MAKFVVPVDYETDRYLLYYIDITRSAFLQNWDSLSAIVNPQIIENRFKPLKYYFEKHHNSKLPNISFDLITMNKHPKNNKRLLEIDQTTTSIFLGIFLKAMMEFQGYILKDKWNLICVTGDLEYKSNRLRFNSVEDIEKKYKGTNTVKSEFMELAANTNNDTYLFLYISDKDIINNGDITRNGITIGNITTKRFSTDNSIEEIISFLFKSFDYNLDIDSVNIENSQKKLIKSIEHDRPDYGYFAGQDFKAIENMMLDIHLEWHWLFIYGEGNTGKSSAAKAISRHLVHRGRVCAPIWIKVKKSDIKEIISNNKSVKTNELIQYLEEYFIERIYNILIKADDSSNSNQYKSELIKNELSRNKYIIIIDNLEIHENYVNYIVQSIQNIFFMYEHKPYLIITSRSKYDFSTLELKNIFITLTTETPKIDKKQIKNLVKNIAKTFPRANKKINEAIKNKTFDRFINVIFNKIGDCPDLIIIYVLTLDKLTKNIEQVIDDINNKKKLRINIYNTIFHYLNILQKQILYIFLNFGEDNFISINDIHGKIREYPHHKNNTIEDRDIYEVLDVLGNYCLIYSNPAGTAFSMKSITYYTLLFEKEFLGEKTKSGEYPRDIFVSLSLQLEKALECDKSKKLITSLINKIKNKNIEIDKDKLIYIAAQYISNPDILDNLIEFGCDIDGNAKDAPTPFFIATVVNNSDEIKKWFTYKGARYLANVKCYKNTNFDELEEHLDIIYDYIDYKNYNYAKIELDKLWLQYFNYIELHYCYGYLYEQVGNYDKTIIYWNRVLYEQRMKDKNINDIKTTIANVHYERAVRLANNEKDYYESAVELSRVIKLKPDSLNYFLAKEGLQKLILHLNDTVRNCDESDIYINNPTLKEKTANALYDLGRLCMEGIGVEQDYKKAEILLKGATKIGNINVSELLNEIESHNQNNDPIVNIQLFHDAYTRNFYFPMFISSMEICKTCKVLPGKIFQTEIILYDKLDNIVKTSNKYKDEETFFIYKNIDLLRKNESVDWYRENLVFFRYKYFDEEDNLLFTVNITPEEY